MRVKARPHLKSDDKNVTPRQFVLKPFLDFGGSAPKRLNMTLVMKPLRLSMPEKPLGTSEHA